MTETPPLPAFTCAEAGCQIALGGTCLEAFPDPNVCPHASAATAEADGVEPDEAEYDTEEEAIDDTETHPIADEVQNPDPQLELVAVPGDEALSTSEAGAMMARHPVMMVLVAGEAAAGKTTLVAEIFARFLTGRFGTWSFGGSDTLRAFHIRLHPSFAESGAGTGTTERTADEELRFLHLDLARRGQRVHILASDGKGEYFENLIDGNPVGDELPIAGRVDRCIIAVDGVRINNPNLRDSTLRRARLLLRALRGPDGISEQCPVALVCTKWDMVVEPNRASTMERLKELASAQVGNVTVLTASVRPGPPIEDVAGLAEILDFIAQPEPPTVLTSVSSSAAAEATDDRYFWRAWPAIAKEADD